MFFLLNHLPTKTRVGAWGHRRSFVCWCFFFKKKKKRKKNKGRRAELAAGTRHRTDRKDSRAGQLMANAAAIISRSAGTHPPNPLSPTPPPPTSHWRRPHARFAYDLHTKSRGRRHFAACSSLITAAADADVDAANFFFFHPHFFCVFFFLCFCRRRRRDDGKRLHSREIDANGPYKKKIIEK